MTKTETTITIFRDGVWAGTGRLDEYNCIVDCAAVLGPDQDASDETYELMEHDIQDAGSKSREGRLTRPDGVYRWKIEAKE